jgi:hypothetical protein
LENSVEPQFAHLLFIVPVTCFALWCIGLLVKSSTLRGCVLVLVVVWGFIAPIVLTLGESFEANIAYQGAVGVMLEDLVADLHQDCAGTLAELEAATADFDPTYENTTSFNKLLARLKAYSPPRAAGE